MKLKFKIYIDELLAIGELKSGIINAPAFLIPERKQGYMHVLLQKDAEDRL